MTVMALHDHSCFLHQPKNIIGRVNAPDIGGVSNRNLLQRARYLLPAITDPPENIV